MRYKTGNKIKCSSCGKKIYRKPFLIRKHKNHFCNRDCHANWKIKNMGGINNPNYRSSGNRVCGGCGKTYFSYNKNRRFCGINCGQKYEKEHPMYKAIIGNKYEIKCIKILFKEGWLAGRTQASRSPFDVVAVKGNIIKFIQVKKTGTRKNLSPSLWKDIINLKVPNFATKEVWVNNKDENWEIIKL